MKFSARYLPPGGSVIQREILEGTSSVEVQRRLLSGGSIVLELRPVTRVQKPIRRRLPFDVAWWCRELETLLRAGMTAVEAIETLAASEGDQVRNDVHAALLRALQEGASLSRAMRLSHAFPEVLIAGVTASERTSTLPDALRDYLRYDELIQTLRRQAMSAAIYPAIVTALGFVISVFLLLYVIPRFSRMYGELHGDLSFTTKSVLWLSGTLRNGWPLGLLLIGGLLALAVVGWRSGRMVRVFSLFIEAVPPLLKQWNHFRLAKLYQSLALLFRGGYSFDEALQVCCGLDLGHRLHAGLNETRELIARGKPASSALTSAGLTEITTQRLLVVGERTGEFATVLQTIADRHAQMFATFVERATRIIEPVLLLGVALVVGGLVVMMYMPIFDIAGGLGGTP